MSDVEAIAAELRRGYEAGTGAATDALQRRFADKVEVVHIPPSAMDGIVDRDTMNAHHAVEHAAFARVMPDFREHASVSVSGNDIEVEMTISGTLADGHAIEITIPAVYAIESGEIVRVTARVDPDQTATLREALAAIGFAPGAAAESQSDEQTPS